MTARRGFSSVVLSLLFLGTAQGATLQVRPIEPDPTTGTSRAVVVGPAPLAHTGASKVLNDLRPGYYDRKRPPAASKAMVSGIGPPGKTITLDMIAIPTLAVPASPPEHGHGLTAKEAAEGWLALFDGQTTFGWKEATVAKGTLAGPGRTTSEFPRCALRAVVVQGGILTAGGKEHRVTTGNLSLDDSGGSGPIHLGKGAVIRKLIVRPLGMKVLYNGKDMTGWKRIDHPRLPAARRPTWKVENGKLVARGGPGALEYQGGRYGDLVLQVEVRTRARHVNGGLFFRCVPGDFMNGYEAQIYNRCLDGDPARPAFWCTGGIDDRQNARRMVSRDLVPFTMTVVARGPHLALWVNGVQVTDWTDTRSRHDNPRRGLRTKPGTIQLQAHDAETDLEFRDIRLLDWLRKAR
jgi:3-keto-disaccharide hydrolase